MTQPPIGAAAAGAAAVVFGPVTFTYAATGDQVRRLTGHNAYLTQASALSDAFAD